MGSSYALVGELRISPDAMGAFRASEVQATDVAPPPGWGRPNESGPRPVSWVLDALAAEDHLDVTSTEGSVRVCGAVSDDSGAWLDLRSHLVAVFLAAAAHGGEGRLCLTGGRDADPGIAFLARIGGGASSFQRLRGEAATALEAEVDAAVSEVLARRAPPPPPPPALDRVLDATSRAVHAATLAALAQVPAEGIEQAARGHDDHWPSPARQYTHATIAAIFPGAPQLLEGLRHGWAHLIDRDTRRIPALALELLTAADPTAARALAAAHAGAAAPYPLDSALASAQSDVIDEASCRDTLARLRALFDRTPGMRGLQGHRDPLVRRLRTAPSPAVSEVLLDELHRAAGGPCVGRPWSELAPVEVAWVELLADVLRFRPVEPRVEAALIAVWVHHQDPALHRFQVAFDRSPEGAAAFAPLFGLRFPEHRERAERQLLAARALLLADATGEELVRRASDIVAETDLDDGQIAALDAAAQVLEARPTLDPPGACDLLAAIHARCSGSAVGNRALGALAARGDERAIRVLVDELDRPEVVDLALAMLDRRALDALRARVATLTDPTCKKRVLARIAKLEQPTGHHVGLAPTGRATCRTCKQKIEKGAVRFAEEIPGDALGRPEAGHVFHHLACAARKRAALLKPALAAYAGEVPDRQAVEAELEATLARASRSTGTKPRAR